MSIASRARAAALGLMVLFVVPAAQAANCNAIDAGSVLTCVMNANTGDTVTLTADVNLVATLPIDTAGKDIEILHAGGKFTGSGAIYKNGLGTLTMGGVNDFTGNAEVYGGTLAIRTATAIGAGSVFPRGGTLRFLASMTFSPPVLAGVNPTMTIVADTGTTVTLSPTSVSYPSGEIVFGDAIHLGTFVFSPAFLGAPPFGSAARIGGGTFRPGLQSLSGLMISWDTFTIDAPGTFDMNGFDHIVKDLRGAGNVLMSAALTVKAANFAGAITGANPGPRLTIDFGAGATFTGNGSSVYEVGMSGPVTWSGSGYIAGRLLVFSSLTIDRADDFTLANPLFANGTIVKKNANTLAMNLLGSTFDGPIDIQAGTLQVCAGSGFGHLGNSIITNAGVLAVTCDNATLQNLISGAGSVELRRGATELSNAANAYSGDTFVKDGAQLLVGVNGTPAGTGTLFLQGGTLRGIGSVTFGGNLQVDSGVSNVSTIAANTGTTFTVVGNHSHLQSIRFNGPAWAGEVRFGIVSGTVNIGGRTNEVVNGLVTAVNVTANFLLQRPTTLQAGATWNTGGFGTVLSTSLTGSGTLQLAGTDSVWLTSANFPGTITGSGNVRIINTDSTLSGDNTYTGTTTIDGGRTLTIGAGGATGTPGTGNITMSGNLTIIRSGALGIASVISGGGQLSSVGAGTLTLAGANTYVGNTNISNGVLVVTGSIASSPLTTIGSAELRGTGTTGAVIAVGASKVAPGLSPGILATGNFAISAPASLDIEINGTTPGTQHDQVDVTGTVAVGTATLNVTLGYVPIVGSTYTIIRNDGVDPVGGTFTGLAQGATFIVGTTQFSISYAGGDGNDVVLTAAASLPGAPTIVSAMPGNAQATVTWNAAAPNGSPVLDYELTCGAVVVNPAMSPQVVAGLANGATVACTVRARNAVGYGPASAPMMVTPSFNTFTGPSATGSGMITASFTGGGAACSFVANPEFIPVEGHAKSPPAGTAPGGIAAFAHGLFDFSTTGCTAGSTITMTITYPTAIPGAARYWKYGPTPGDPAAHWYQLPAAIAGNTIAFSITDGGLGDDDLAANGTIVDQGGPGIGAAGATNVPTMSQWMLLLMAMLVCATGAAFTYDRRLGKNQR